MPTSFFNPFNVLEQERPDLQGKFEPAPLPTVPGQVDRRPYNPQEFKGRNHPPDHPRMMQQVEAEAPAVPAAVAEDAPATDQFGGIIEGPAVEGAPSTDQFGGIIEGPLPEQPYDVKLWQGGPTLFSMDRDRLAAKGIEQVRQWSSGFSTKLTDAVLGVAQDMPLGPAIPVPKSVRNAFMSAIGRAYNDDPNADLIGVAKQWLDERGVTDHNLDTVASRMGGESLLAMLGLGAIGFNASRLAASKGPGVWAYLKRNLGEFIVKHPHLAVATEVAGASGASGGGDVVEGMGGPRFLGELAGGVAGGVTLGGAASLGTRAARTVHGIGKTAADFIPGMDAAGRALQRVPGVSVVDEFMSKLGLQANRPLESEPLRYGRDDLLDLPKTFFEDQINADKLAAERELMGVFQRLPQNATPEEKSFLTNKLLHDAEDKIARRQERKLWSKVKQNKPVPVDNIRQEAVTMLRAAERGKTFGNAPGKIALYLSGAEDEAARTFDGVTYPVFDGEHSIKFLRDIKGHLFSARKEEGAKVGADERLMAGYNQLEAAIIKAIDDAYPNDLATKQAVEFTKFKHELFDPPAIRRVLARDVKGQPAVPPGHTVEDLLRNYPGLEQLVQVSKRLRGQTIIGITDPARLKVSERQALEQMEKAAHENILAQITREFQDNATPESAVAGARNARNLAARRMRDPQIRNLPRTASELARTVQHADAVFAREKMIKESEFAKFVGAGPDGIDPAIAIKKVFDSRNPAATAKALVDRLRDNEDALLGFRQLTFEELVRRTKFNPERMQAVLQTPERRRMLEEIMDPGEFDRLQRMTSALIDIAGARQTTKLRHAITPAGTVAAQIFGAAYGRWVSHRLGGGTIQIPGKFSKLFGDQFNKIMNPDGVLNGYIKGGHELTPERLFAFAVQDPQMERWLFSKAPTNAKEMAKSARLLRKALAGIEGARQAVMSEEE